MPKPAALIHGIVILILLNFTYAPGFGAIIGISSAAVGALPAVGALFSRSATVGFTEVVPGAATVVSGWEALVGFGTGAAVVPSGAFVGAAVAFAAAVSRFAAVVSRFAAAGPDADEEADSCSDSLPEADVPNPSAAPSGAIELSLEAVSAAVVSATVPDVFLKITGACPL